MATQKRATRKSTSAKVAKRYKTQAQQPRKTNRQYNSPPVSFTRLRSGEWAIRSTRPLKPGHEVQVMKKDGSVQDVLIAHLIWTNHDPADPVFIYARGVIQYAQDEELNEIPY